MTSTIFTIGFTKKTAEEFFRLLQEAQVQKLIDIRENRGGQLAGFAKYPDLAFFLHRVAGIAYNYQSILAPSAEIRTAYRKSHDWAQYEKSYVELMAQRQVLEQVDPASFEEKVALLCSEAEPEKCHRRLIAEMLARHWTSQGHQIEVRHLVSAKPTCQKKRTKASHARADSF
ncbi:MAG TPA: DUF488 domain-containing protein [Terriglobia bacterium]|nr:DUF488 domain-containing protein [Terriglobia bacterium]